MSATTAESPQARLEKLTALFGASQYAAAADIAKAMDADRQWHPLQIVLTAHLGVLLRDDAMLARGLELLDFVRQADPASIPSLHEFEQTFIAGHAIGAFRSRDRATALKLLEISRRISGEVARAFPAPVSRDLPPPRLRMPHYLPNVPLLSFEDSPRDPPTRRALGILRKYFSGPDSREHDITARMCRGLELGGWTCPMHDPSYEGGTPVEVTADRLIAAVADYDPEVILFDNDGIGLVPGAFDRFAEWLRRFRPQTKLVHVNFDPWMKPQWEKLRAVAGQVDLVWSHFPAHSVWSAPEFIGKMCFLPFPIGVRLDEIRSVERRAATVFQGAVEWYNFSRAFWLSALAEVDAPIEIRLTGHNHDGLGPIESYLRYLEGYRSVDRLLSFSLRPGDARIITGRSFEAIFAGACLIQEQTDDMDSFFMPSVHYVAFTTFQELRDVLATLDARPDLVRSIARRGQEYYLEHYSDLKIASGLDRALFGP